MNLKSIIFILLLFDKIFAQSLSIEDKIQNALTHEDYQKVIELINNNQDKIAESIRHYYLGIAYQRLFEYERAILNLEEARSCESTNIKVLLSLADCYINIQERNKAISIYNEILIEFPNNIVALGRLGKLFFESKSYESALEIYLKLISLKNDNSYFYEQLGKCYLNIGQLDYAIKQFKMAIQLNVARVTSYIYLSNIYVTLNHVDSALTVINTGLKNNPDNTLLLHSKADRLFAKKEFEESINIYKNLILLGDSTATILRKTGMNYYHWGDIPVALDFFERSFYKDSTEAYTHFYLGLTYKELGKYSFAIFWLRKALTPLLPKIIPDVYLMLGYCYDKNNEYVNAINIYKLLYNTYPDRKDALFYLGSIYDRYYADPDVALEYYQKYLNEVQDPSMIFKVYSQERIRLLKEKKHFLKDK
jgi:tetratricopeptide (TPR) repeat protein